MKIRINKNSRSASVKVGIIAILTLVLLIPLGMTRGVVSDRKVVKSIAASDIRHSWGADQTITGPILRLPYKVENKTVYGSPYTEERVVHLLAEELIITAKVETELRYRGIHKVPVFSADIGIRGKMDLAALDTLGIAAEQVVWSGAEVLIGVSDPKSISEIPVVATDGTDVSFTTGRSGIEGLASQLSAKLGPQLEGTQPVSELALDISLAINGSGSLQFLPLAENADVNMSANWASPSFTGRQLPTVRAVREDGFDASWHSTSLGRKLPAAWIDNHAVQITAVADAYGARFIQPVGLYQLIERATKYGVLFVGLTFVSYFLMELVGDLKLHPLQYLLVGLANTLFYLLLLSLSEHIGFDIAYVVSAMASATLIAGYSAAILERRTRAAMMAAVLAALYGFLYLILNAESFALLAGSIGLWIALAVVMFLTRRINWYAADEVSQKLRTED